MKLGQRGVRVNTIACGPFESKMMEETLKNVLPLTSPFSSGHKQCCICFEVNGVLYLGYELTIVWRNDQRGRAIRKNW